MNRFILRIRATPNFSNQSEHGQVDREQLPRYEPLQCFFFVCVRDLRQPQSSWETQKERQGQIEKLQLRVIRGHRRGKADTLTSSGDLISSLEGGGCHIVTLCSTSQPSRTNTPVVQCLPSINPACQMQCFLNHFDLSRASIWWKARGKHREKGGRTWNAIGRTVCLSNSSRRDRFIV